MPRTFYDADVRLPDGRIRPAALQSGRGLAGRQRRRCRASRKSARRLIVRYRRLGITFAVYGEDSGTERLIPVRPGPAHHLRRPSGQTLERGLKQRVRALNAVPRATSTTTSAILKAGVGAGRAASSATAVPRARCAASTCRGGIYAHIAGVDVVRASEGEFYVLEDNLRVPVGRVVHAREPQDDDAAASRAVRAR